MDTEKILQLIRPYVVESQMTYADFERAFGFLERHERDAVRDIIRDALKIFLVDEQERQDLCVKNSGLDLEDLFQVTSACCGRPKGSTSARIRSSALTRRGGLSRRFAAPS